MTNKDIEIQFENLINKVWGEILGRPTNLNLSDFRKYYTENIRLLNVVKSSFSNEEVFLGLKRSKVIDTKELEVRISRDGFMLPKEEISSYESLLEKVNRVNYFSGSFSKNSDNVFCSDQIYSSLNIYSSYSLRSCNRVAFSYSLRDCEMVFASEDCKESNYCIRIFESQLLNNCFEMYNCGKCSNSMLSHDCYDLRDCLFCFHLNSKQYCIANMQYSKEEYEKIKKMLVEQLIKNKDIKIDDLS